MISLIVAHDRNSVIGLNGKMSWGHTIKTDLNWFRKVTVGSVVIMGRKTFESIGKPLPMRTNVILTTDQTKTQYYRDMNCNVCHSVEEVLSEWVKPNRNAFIIGGYELYSQFIHIADRLYITHIDAEFEGDTFFPEYDLSTYRVTSMNNVRAGEGTPYDLKFAIYEKK